MAKAKHTPGAILERAEEVLAARVTQGYVTAPEVASTYAYKVHPSDVFRLLSNSDKWTITGNDGCVRYFSLKEGMDSNE